MEIPTWSHDPSNQLKRIINKFPEKLAEYLNTLAEITREIAPEHGRSTYGEPDKGLIPSDIYKKKHAEDALAKAIMSREIVEKVFNEINISL